ncbi:nitronate monooxygenase [Lactobacillus psittaci]|nr:nitronate monooxygenase [Lactobacillus psittaci]
MENRLCHALGINTPIIHYPMHTMTNGKMVAAISEAGGLGILGINAGYNVTDATTGASSTDSEVIGNPDNYSILDTMTERNLMNEQINTAIENTFRPFGVEVASKEDSPEKDPTAKSIVELMRKRRLTIALFEGFGKPISKPWVDILHSNGIKILQFVVDFNSATLAINNGLDIVIVNQLALAKRIHKKYPDIIICVKGSDDFSKSKKQLNQVDGIYLNTPFAICKEAIIDDSIRNRLLSAQPTDLVTLSLPFGNFLTFKTPYIEKILTQNLSPNELFKELNRYQGLIDGMVKGNLNQGYCLFDLDSYLIKHSISAQEIINKIYPE